MRGSVGDGQVLQHSRDTALDNLFHFIPEWNLRDIISGPDHFLDMLKFRATTDLSDQVVTSDGPHIDHAMKQYGLCNSSTGWNTDHFMVFRIAEGYGRVMKLNVPYSVFRERAPILISSGLCVPAATGELILQRQKSLLQFLNHLVEETLDLGPETRGQHDSTKARDTTVAVTTALSVMRLEPPTQKLSLADVLSQCLEQKLALEDYLHLLQNEPQVLDSGAMSMYYSRPELVPDERGRINPAMTDVHLSAALDEMVTSAVQAIADWDHILRLLQLLESFSSKSKRPIILDELANACHLEYRRAQAALKRQMSSPFSFASKSFQRNGTSQDMPKIKIKGRPADWTVADPPTSLSPSTLSSGHQFQTSRRVDPKTRRPQHKI